LNDREVERNVFDFERVDVVVDSRRKFTQISCRGFCSGVCIFAEFLVVLLLSFYIQLYSWTLFQAFTRLCISDNTAIYRSCFTFTYNTFIQILMLMLQSGHISMHTEVGLWFAIDNIISVVRNKLSMIFLCSVRFVPLRRQSVCLASSFCWGASLAQACSLVCTGGPGFDSPEQTSSTLLPYLPGRWSEKQTCHEVTAMYRRLLSWFKHVMVTWDKAVAGSN